MLAARALWMARRSAGLLSGFGPPAFAAMTMSLVMRVKALAIRFHRANMVALRVSKMRPMGSSAPLAPAPRHGRIPQPRAARKAPRPPGRAERPGAGPAALPHPGEREARGTGSPPAGFPPPGHGWNASAQWP